MVFREACPSSVSLESENAIFGVSSTRSDDGFPRPHDDRRFTLGEEY